MTALIGISWRGMIDGRGECWAGDLRLVPPLAAQRRTPGRAQANSADPARGVAPGFLMQSFAQQCRRDSASGQIAAVRPSVAGRRAARSLT
ncbi:hypothetical protein [Tahibacter caeni]|uniref:hypothetical protein n=1 Tax=Tahibacter caeni TaxID=1453545 RepID=UPI0021471DCC|nr:hypothetical protein [Tahibacter caeni]